MREKPARTKQARLAAGREGETVEHKSQWTERALEDLAAFANHKGGTLLVGIADGGRVIGFPHTDKDLQAVANQIADTLGVRPRVRAERRGTKTVLSITVKPSLMPVSCRGRYLIRVGSVNREMTPDQIARRFVEKLGQTWDALPSGLKPDAVDPEALRHFARLAATRLPQVRESDPPLRTLENLELLRDGTLTNGGALLFARRPQQVCSSATLHIGRFKAGVVEDDRTAAGTLWMQLDAALAAFRTYLQVRFEVAPKTATVEGLQRKEIWEYPLDALREAVINALIHRDYTALGEIQARVREDSIEVWNPGGLPEGVKLEDLRREGHTSRPRNPSLAQMLFYAGLVERWGSGTTNMIRACREQDLPEPEFSEHTGGFVVTFSKDLYTPERLRRMGLNERQITAVGETKQSGTITNERYTKLVGVSKATATRDLEELVGAGILERHGRTGRGTRYQLMGSKTAQTAHERLKKGSADSGRSKHR